MTSKASVFARSVRAMKRFFWFCSGADVSILDRVECSTEHNKYAAIGSTVLLTAILASISGGYALFTVFRRYPQSVAFGVLWGLLIFNLDRYIVMSMRAERTGNKRRVLTALPRLVLAMLISVVVAVPLELKIFDREIADELTKTNNASFEQSQKQIEEIYKKSVERWDADIARLRKEAEEDWDTYQDLFKQATLEASGKGGSGQFGRGPQYERLQEAAEAAKKTWESKQRELEKKQAEYDGVPEVRQASEEKTRRLKAAEESARENTGLLAGLKTLHVLMLRESSTLVSFCLLALLFVTLETAPVVVKFLSARGPYDAFLEAKEAEIVAREELRTSDAAAKAANDSQIDEAIRRKEFDEVQATLQGVSADPALADTMKQRLSDRFSRMIDSVLPVDDSRFGREYETHRYSQSNTVRRWRTITPITVLVLVVLGCLAWLGLALLRRSPSAGAPEAYVWKDAAKGSSYLAVIGPAGFDPLRLFPEQNDLLFQLADVKAPLREPPRGTGLTMSVYTIGKHTSSRQSLADPASAPIVHLFGETHLGKSQLEEAGLISKMLREQEVDAIFLEQPDNLTFDWKPFADLESNPQRAIDALQYQMRLDANSVPEMNLGRFNEFFLEGDLTTPAGLKMMEDRIREAYGDDGVDEFRAKAYEELQRVSNSPAGRAYAESAYISAADYIYVMTHLLKIGIPYYNVDSARLRDSYQPYNGLGEREDFTAKQIAKITHENGYHNVLYVCGAFHLKGVVAALTAAGLQPSVEMNSLRGAIKEKIAALVHPQLLVDRARKEPPPGAVDDDLKLKDDPSDQLVNELNKYLNNEKEGGAFDADDIAAFRNEFVKKYANEKLRELDKWSLAIVNTTGKKALLLSWDKHAGGELDIVYDRDLSESDLRQISVGNGSVRELNYQDHQLAKEANETSHEFVLATVRKDLTLYSLTLGDVFRKELTARQLIDEINGWLKRNPRRVIYLDLADFSVNDFEALAFNCETLQGEVDSSLSMVPFKVDSQDSSLKTAFLSATPLRSIRIERNIEKIQTGPYKGWFALQVAAEAAGRVSEKLVVKVIVKSYELAMRLFRIFDVMFSTLTNGSVDFSLAELLARVTHQAVGARPSDEKIRLQIFREVVALERGTDGGIDV